MRKYEMFGLVTDSMVMHLSKVQDMVKDREAWHATAHVVTESLTGLNDITTKIYTYRCDIPCVCMCGICLKMQIYLGKIFIGKITLNTSACIS